MVRTGLVLAGLVTGPFALIAYLCVYFELYFTEARGDAPRIEPWPVAKHVLGAVAGLVLLCVAERGALWVGAYGFMRWTGKIAPSGLKPWDWIQRNDGMLLFWATVCALPLGILAGLPLANRWSESVCRVMQAVLALYAVAIFGGVGAYYAGLITFVATAK